MNKTGRAKTSPAMAVIWILATAAWSHAAWPTAHGSAANTGFARVDTLPAVYPTGYANVGRVAAGANPVVGPDGTVYIGNLAGELIALHADGTPYWSRKLNPEHGAIFASPAIGADGSIYVVSHLSRSEQGKTFHATFLHKFSPGGGWYFWRPFPAVTAWDGGFTTAPPNIWSWNGSEAIMTPVVYTNGLQLRLIAFSSDGAVIGNQIVRIEAPTTSSSGGVVSWVINGIVGAIGGCITNFPEGCLPSFSVHLGGDLPEVGWPQPGVAIWEYPQGSPYVWVADGVRSTVAYKFDLAAGFSEIYRFTDDKDRLSSPPVALDNVIAAVGTSDGRLKFERDNFSLAGFGEITAAPTRMANGRLVVVSRGGTMIVLNGYSVIQQQPLAGPSIASAAASCTHLYVSSADELLTLDVKTMTAVAHLPWTEGGRHSPVIGPSGHVYAMTNFGLFVFAAPKKLPIVTIGVKTACDQPVLNGRLGARLE